MTNLKRKKENWKQPLNLLILVENSSLSLTCSVLEEGLDGGRGLVEMSAVS